MSYDSQTLRLHYDWISLQNLIPLNSIEFTNSITPSLWFPKSALMYSIHYKPHCSCFTVVPHVTIWTLYSHKLHLSVRFESLIILRFLASKKIWYERKVCGFINLRWQEELDFHISIKHVCTTACVYCEFISLLKLDLLVDEISSVYKSLALSQV